MRLLRVTKDDLGHACDRAVAWRRVLELPRPPRAEQAATERGTTFHAILAEVLGEADPVAAFALAVGSVPPSERAPYEHYFAEHRRLMASPGHELLLLRGAEVTLPLRHVVTDGWHSERNPSGAVAVLLTVVLDALYDGPAGEVHVVEHKTAGADTEPDPWELDLEALAAARHAGSWPVVVHVHFLGTADGCRRRRYEPAELDAARDAVAARVGAIARWQPGRAHIEPRPSPGPHCGACEHRERCDARAS